MGVQPPSSGTIGGYSLVFQTSDSLGAFHDVPGVEAMVDLSTYDGEPLLYVCFRYSALLDRYAEVDDVAVGPAACIDAVRQLRKRSITSHRRP